MGTLLGQKTKRFPSGNGVKPVQEIFSYRQILICSLHSSDYNGCSRKELYDEIVSKFRIKVDLNNPYIKERLDEISDPNCVKARGNYKLGFKTKLANRNLLEWWTTNYETSCNVNVQYHFNQNYDNMMQNSYHSNL